MGNSDVGKSKYQNDTNGIISVESIDTIKSELDEICDIVHVYDVSEKNIVLCNDMKKEGIVCYVEE